MYTCGMFISYVFVAEDNATPLKQVVPETKLVD
jgi:hypothetical protein